jgi:hypothetical protein
VAPALHSLIIRGREDVARIVGILCDIHVDLRKVILKKCFLSGDGPAIFANIAALYPDLEALSLEGCPLLPDCYFFISRLKKLHELNIQRSQVHYVHVKLLETHVYIHDHM